MKKINKYEIFMVDGKRIKFPFKDSINIQKSVSMLTLMLQEWHREENNM